MTESGQKIVGEPYLIRSYNHTRRIKATRRVGITSRTTTGMPTSRSNTDISARRANTDLSGHPSVMEPMLRKRKSGTDHWDAQEFEIWEVARAATAAPFYFEPLKIQFPSSPRYLLFKDGGFGYANNPTKEGIREIEEEYGADAMGIVVSVGTARRDEIPRERRVLRFIPVVTEMTQMANDPEKIHKEVRKMSQHEDYPFNYYRLNHPGGLGVQMDEWKPRHGSSKEESGSITVGNIQNAFYGWASKPENIRDFQDCALKLVQRRRARAGNRSKWERYAAGCKFTCRLMGCDREEEFWYREQFREHLRRDHGLDDEVHLEREIAISRKCWRYQ